MTEAPIQPTLERLLREFGSRIALLERGALPRANAITADTGSEAQQSVVSTTFVDVLDMSLTLTTSGRPVLLLANVRAGTLVTGIGVLTFGIDGVDQAQDGLYLVEQGAIPVTMFYLAASLAAGPHTFKVRARVTAGSLALTHGRRERVAAIEL